MFRQLSFFSAFLDVRQPKSRSNGRAEAPVPSVPPPANARPRSKPRPGSARGAGGGEPREALLFDGRDVAIQRKAYRRTISLTLKVNGEIRVIAPRTAPLPKIQAFLIANREWLRTNLRRYEELREKHPPKRFVEGEEFPFFGTMVRLQFRFGDLAKARASVRDGLLVVELPASERERIERGPRPRADVADAVARLYEAEGRRVLAARAAVLSERMQLRPSALSFRSQKTRWGSCSSRGRVSLNWRLAIAPLEVVDYVIAHELAHLKHYDHSPAFWRLVATQIPDYRERRAWLRAHQYDADFLAKRSELHRE